MPNQQPQLTPPQTDSQNGWFDALTWKTALIIAGLSIVTGGGTAAGITATKAVAAEPRGITQDQADVRYLTKTEAAALRESRDKQFEKLDKEVLKTAVYEAYRSADNDRLARIEKMLEKMVESRDGK